MAAMKTLERPPLAEWVKRRRLTLGYRTQEDLAEAMGEGVSTSYIGNLESGRTYVPRQPFLRQLAEALHVSEIEVIRAAGLLTETHEATRIGDCRSAYDPNDPRARVVAWLNQASDTQVEMLLVMTRAVDMATNAERGGRSARTPALVPTT